MSAGISVAVDGGGIIQFDQNFRNYAIKEAYHFWDLSKFYIDPYPFYFMHLPDSAFEGVETASILFLPQGQGIAVCPNIITLRDGRKVVPYYTSGNPDLSGFRLVFLRPTNIVQQHAVGIEVYDEQGRPTFSTGERYPKYMGRSGAFYRDPNLGANNNLARVYNPPSGAGIFMGTVAGWGYTNLGGIWTSPPFINWLNPAFFEIGALTYSSQYSSVRGELLYFSD